MPAHVNIATRRAVYNRVKNADRPLTCREATDCMEDYKGSMRYRQVVDLASTGALVLAGKVRVPESTKPVQVYTAARPVDVCPHVADLPPERTPTAPCLMGLDEDQAFALAIMGVLDLHQCGREGEWLYSVNPEWQAARERATTSGRVCTAAPNTANTPKSAPVRVPKVRVVTPAAPEPARLATAPKPGVTWAPLAADSLPPADTALLLKGGPDIGVDGTFVVECADYTKDLVGRAHLVGFAGMPASLASRITHWCPL